MNRAGDITSVHARKALVLIFAGALFLRIFGLWAYLPTMDEVQFLIISQGESFHEIARRALAEVHPPLTWFLRHFLLIASPDIFVQRLFSVALGMGSIQGAYLLGRTAFANRQCGLFCALLVAFTPQSVVASMGLRNYALLMPLLMFALLFFLRWQKKEKLRDMLTFSLLMSAACATHFSAFLVAAGCGFCAGLALLFQGRLRTLATLCLAYLPVLALAAAFYPFYLAPGATISMWKHFMLETGFTPQQPETGIVNTLIIPLLAYFSPLLAAVHKSGLDGQAQAIAQALTLAGGVALLGLYGYALTRLRGNMLMLVICMWLVALGLTLTDMYPFSANRHNLYFLPFFILPLAALLGKKLHYSPAPLACVIVIAIIVNEAAIWRDEDFCLTKPNFDAGQAYLHGKLMPGDAIVTGPMGAYFYLIYAHDAGKTPYNDYTDKPYYNATTLLAPFASPYKPYNNWRPFRDELKRRMDEGVAKQGNVWFVQYGWKNQELWFLMHCEAAQPLMANHFSRDGVVMFSMEAGALSGFLENTAAWEACYAGYKPLVIGTPFKQASELQ